MSNFKIQGNAGGAGTTTLQSANTGSSTTFTWPAIDGSSGQFIQTDGAGNLVFASGLQTTVANTFTAAQTFRAANAIRSEAAATQDAVVIAGRAGGSSSYAVTLTPTTLSANRTVTLADGDVTLTAGTTAVIGTAQTFTAAQTFRAANAIRSEAAATQDAVVIAGRAGGTNSYAITLTPATLISSTTLTLPNVTDTIATIGTAQTFTAAQTFRAANAIRSEAAATQDAVVIAGRAGGSSSYAVTLTPTTLSANRTVTIPNESFTIGFRNLPPVGTKTGSYTLAIDDVGKYVQCSSGASITIPTGVFSEGDAITLYNTTAGNITITCSALTTYIAGTDATKTSLALATRGVASILFISGSLCVVTGSVS